MSSSRALIIGPDSAGRCEDIFRHSQKMRAIEEVVVRLAAVPTPVLIRVPPLRHRREEIDPLVQRFLERFARKFHRPVPHVSEAMAELLRTYTWPGNVRELEQIVKRWVVLGDEDHVRDEIEARRVAEQ